MEHPRTIVIQTPADVALARCEARAIAVMAGLDPFQLEMVLLTVSELGTNLLRYAPGGSITLTGVNDAGRSGVQVESRDLGPGIVDLNLAMQDNFSTGGGLGSGLPGIQRLMDDFAISSSPEGTTVTACKWTTLPAR